MVMYDMAKQGPNMRGSSSRDLRQPYEARRSLVMTLTRPAFEMILYRGLQWD